MRNLIALLAACVLVTGCGGKRADTTAGADSGDCAAAEGRITIATGDTGGVYHTLGGGMAQLISGKTPLKATARGDRRVRAEHPAARLRDYDRPSP